MGMSVEDKMRIVLELAKEGMKQGEVPIAAVIFHGDEIASKAYTTEKRDGRFLVHAELLAMLEMDQQKPPFHVRREMQLYTNLEPCMMCFGTAISSFVGEVYYSIDSPTDGGAVWAEKSWDAHHPPSVFSLPSIYKGILAEESRELFRRFLNQCPEGGIRNWVKTLL